MKQLLYVIHQVENKIIEFKVAEILEETETEYYLVDTINIIERINTFPKKFLDKEFQFGYVTLKNDKELLNKQLKRVYKNISDSNEYYENLYREAQEKNDIFYKVSMDTINFLK